jgi:hypothetical protein
MDTVTPPDLAVHGTPNAVTYYRHRTDRHPCPACGSTEDCYYWRRGDDDTIRVVCCRHKGTTLKRTRAGKEYWLVGERVGDVVVYLGGDPSSKPLPTDNTWEKVTSSEVVDPDPVPDDEPVADQTTHAPNHTDTGFVEVSTRNPCPVCRKPDWCEWIVGPGDRVRVICMRYDTMARQMYDGPTPMFVAVANTPGTGKGSWSRSPVRSSSAGRSPQRAGRTTRRRPGRRLRPPPWPVVRSTCSTTSPARSATPRSPRR